LGNAIKNKKHNFTVMILIGYSGHAFVAHGICTANKIVVTGYCDAVQKTYNPFNLTYLGPEANNVAQLKNGFFIAIGNNQTRQNIANTLLANQLQATTIIHPSAVICTSVSLSNNGVMVAANATINPLTKIAQGAICNTNCSIDHECNIGPYAHIGPGAVLCGNVQVGEGSFIGANAVIKQGITIGTNALVGAGAVVTKNVPNGAVVWGNPAKIQS
jgi:sugar O-acyltransferase (sialic acid O-acetyltransferase NeuD family)